MGPLVCFLLGVGKQSQPSGQRRRGDPERSRRLSARSALVYLRPEGANMAVYLVKSQPLGCSPQKPLLAARLRAGRWGCRLDGFGGGASQGRLSRLGFRRPLGQLAFFGLRKCCQRELLPLKRLWKVLYHGQRENLYRSPSPKSRELGARDPDTRRRGGGVVM